MFIEFVFVKSYNFDDTSIEINILFMLECYWGEILHNI